MKKNGFVFVFWCSLIMMFHTKLFKKFFVYLTLALKYLPQRDTTSFHKSQHWGKTMTQHTDLKQGLGVSGGEGRQAGGGG